MKGWCSIVVFVSLLLVSACATTAADCPQAGQAMPDLQLATPEDEVQRGYLGLAAGQSFRLSDLKAEILVIEIFSMYCPYCQREAPNVNRFHELVTRDSKAAERIRIFGIGVSNSSYEVKVFQNQYAIKFPLIPDPDLAVHDQVGSVRTPHFFVLKRAADGTRQVIYSESGGFGRADAFLQLILEKAGQAAGAKP